MELKKIDYLKVFNFFKSTVDLKKYVFINLRKQIGQKMEGFSAS